MSKKSKSQRDMDEKKPRCPKCDSVNVIDVGGVIGGSEAYVLERSCLDCEHSWEGKWLDKEF